jgi:phage terminase large subunit-like protein
MLLFGVTIPATVPQRSEILEELMNYPVYIIARNVAS